MHQSAIRRRGMTNFQIESRNPQISWTLTLMDEFLPKTHQSCASGVHWSDQFAPRGALDGRACDEYARTHQRGALHGARPRPAAEARCLARAAHTPWGGGAGAAGPRSTRCMGPAHPGGPVALVARARVWGRTSRAAGRHAGATQTHAISGRGARQPAACRPAAAGSLAGPHQRCGARLARSLTSSLRRYSRASGSTCSGARTCGALTAAARQGQWGAAAGHELPVERKREVRLDCRVLRPPPRLYMAPD